MHQKYGDELIFVNFDETPFLYDLSRDRTLHFQGSKEINLLSHPKSKHLYSLCPTIASNGEILDTLVIFYYTYQNAKSGKKRDFPKKAEGFKHNISPIMVRYNSSGYNNQDLLFEWFYKIFMRFVVKHRQKHVALLMDDASFHTSDRIVKACEEQKVSLVIIPGGTTHFLQPLDVGINKPLKDYMRSLYIPWLTDKCLGVDINVQESMTKAGYLRAPTNELIIEWIKEALPKIRKETVVKSFEKTGITSLKDRKDLYMKGKI